MINLKLVEAVFKNCQEQGTEPKWIELHEQFGKPERMGHDLDGMFELCGKYNIEPKCFRHHGKMYIGYVHNRYVTTGFYEIACREYGFTPDDLLMQYGPGPKVDLLKIINDKKYNEHIAVNKIINAANSRQVIAKLLRFYKDNYNE